MLDWWPSEVPPGEGMLGSGAVRGPAGAPEIRQVRILLHGIQRSFDSAVSLFEGESRPERQNAELPSGPKGEVPSSGPHLPEEVKH